MSSHLSHKTRQRDPLDLKILERVLKQVEASRNSCFDSIHPDDEPALQPKDSDSNFLSSTYDGTSGGYTGTRAYYSDENNPLFITQPCALDLKDLTGYQSLRPRRAVAEKDFGSSLTREHKSETVGCWERGSEGLSSPYQDKSKRYASPVSLTRRSRLGNYAEHEDDDENKDRNQTYLPSAACYNEASSAAAGATPISAVHQRMPLSDAHFEHISNKPRISKDKVRTVEGTLFANIGLRSTDDCSFQRSLLRRTSLPSVSEMVKIEGSPSSQVREGKPASHAWISSSSSVASDSSQTGLPRNKYSATSSNTERTGSRLALRSVHNADEHFDEDKSSHSYTKFHYESATRTFVRVGSSGFKANKSSDFATESMKDLCNENVELTVFDALQQPFVELEADAKSSTSKAPIDTALSCGLSTICRSFSTPSTQTPRQHRDNLHQRTPPPAPLPTRSAPFISKVTSSSIPPVLTSRALEFCTNPSAQTNLSRKLAYEHKADPLFDIPIFKNGNANTFFEEEKNVEALYSNNNDLETQSQNYIFKRQDHLTESLHVIQIGLKRNCPFADKTSKLHDSPTSENDEYFLMVMAEQNASASGFRNPKRTRR